MKSIILATVTCMTVAVTAPAQNVLTDGGFEGLSLGTIGDTGGVNLWGNYNDSAGNFTVQSSVVHSGTKAVQMGVVGTGFSILYQNTGSAVSGDEPCIPESPQLAAQATSCQR